MKFEKNCPDCGCNPGKPHTDDCDVQRCSICGQQRITCGCDGHDPIKSVWTGKWPEPTEKPAFLGVAVLARTDPTRPFERDNIHWRTAVSQEEAALGQELHVGADLMRRMLELEEAGWIQLTDEGRKKLDHLAAICPDVDEPTT